MKKLLFFTLCVVLFQNCKKCDDVPLGKVNLMSSSPILVNSLKSKTLIFKDSTGKELRFKNNTNLEQSFRKYNVKQICTGSLGLGGGFEFLEFEAQGVFFTSSDLNIFIELKTEIAETNQAVEVKDTILYDILSLRLFNTNLTSISNQVELSKRGITKPNLVTNNVVTDSITILGKTFKQVINVKNGSKTNGVEPDEVWYNATQGVVALRLLDSKLFVLDKIE